MAKYKIKPIINGAKKILRDSTKYRNLIINTPNLKKGDDMLRSLNEFAELLARKWAEPSVLIDLRNDKNWAEKQSIVLDYRDKISIETKELEQFLNK